MFTKIKSLFESNKTTQDDLNLLQSSSANALDVFNETIKKLLDINSHVKSSIKTRELEIESLKSENIMLTELQDSNNKVIDKLNSIVQ